MTNGHALSHDALATSVWLCLAYSLVVIVAAVLAIMVVRGIHRRQMEKHRRLALAPAPS